MKLHLGGGDVNLTGYTDASYVNCLDTRRSMSGYCFSMGSGITVQFRLIWHPPVTVTGLPKFSFRQFAP
jgi:hypothetical protein